MTEPIISIERVSERLAAARKKIAELENLMLEAQRELQYAVAENKKFFVNKKRVLHIAAGLCYAKLSNKWTAVEKWCPHKGKNDGLCGVHDKGWARAARDEERSRDGRK